MMKKSKRIWLLACVLGAMGNSIVSAEEATPVYMLDTVNVTAQAYEKKELDTPADVTVVTRQELQASGRENIAQALKYEPGWSAPWARMTKAGLREIQGSISVALPVAHW